MCLMQGLSATSWLAASRAHESKAAAALTAHSSQKRQSSGRFRSGRLIQSASHAQNAADLHLLCLETCSLPPTQSHHGFTACLSTNGAPGAACPLVAVVVGDGRGSGRSTGQPGSGCGLGRASGARGPRSGTRLSACWLLYTVANRSWSLTTTVQTSQALAQSLQGGGEAGADDAAGALAL